MRNYLLFIIFLIPINLFAQEFKSTAAQLALDKYKAELKRAEELRLAAELQYKKDLEAALVTAMKTGSLEEANVIKAVLDGKEVIKETKEDKELPPEDKIIESKKLALKLSDKHEGVVGFRPYKDTYTLNLKSAKGKKINMTLNGVYRTYGLCVYEVYLNNVSVGTWELTNKSGEQNTFEKTIDLDITAQVKDSEIKEYIITFKPVTGRGDLNTTEVKATYK